MLRRWICHPLQNVAELNNRLDAVEEFIEREEMACSIREDLRVLPDLERLVARVRGLAGSPNLGVIPMAAKKVHQRRVKPFSHLDLSSIRIGGLTTFCTLTSSLASEAFCYFYFHEVLQILDMFEVMFWQGYFSSQFLFDTANSLVLGCSDMDPSFTSCDTFTCICNLSVLTNL